jgi:uncharacterized paraquat-inducible protein A
MKCSNCGTWMIVPTFGDAYCPRCGYRIKTGDLENMFEGKEGKLLGDKKC